MAKRPNRDSPFTAAELGAIGELAAFYFALSESTEPGVLAVAQLIVIRIGEICMGGKLHTMKPEEVLEFAKKVGGPRLAN
jgi:hypothetical protein